MAAASAFQDNFNTNVQAAQWTLSGPGTPANQIKFVNQELEITTDAITNDYFSCLSTSTFDLTSSYFYAQLVSAGAQAANQDCIPVIAQIDANNKIFISINGGVIQCYKKVTSTQTQVGTNVTYVAATHKWFRLREQSNTTYWDFSTNGFSWTNITSASANPIAVTALNLGFQAGQFGAASATTEKFDNVNCQNSFGNFMAFVP